MKCWHTISSAEERNISMNASLLIYRHRYLPSITFLSRLLPYCDIPKCMALRCHFQQQLTPFLSISVFLTVLRYRITWIYRYIIDLKYRNMFPPSVCISTVMMAHEVCNSQLSNKTCIDFWELYMSKFLKIINLLSLYFDLIPSPLQGEININIWAASSNQAPFLFNKTRTDKPTAQAPFDDHLQTGHFACRFMLTYCNDTTF